jgi:REP element-mobilizing transposase RayT
MSLYRDKYRIESARLKGFDYSSPGEYFVTICTKGLVEFFGEVIQSKMLRNEIGGIAHNCWLEIPKHHRNVAIDEFTVMPNHVHGILVLCGRRDHPNGSASGIAHTFDDDVPVSDVACNVAPSNINEFMSDISPKRGSLSTMIRSYKSAATKLCHANGLEDFEWQPRFYDHIIRSNSELGRIRDYIRNNPAKWEADRNNPSPADLWME